MEFLGNTHLVTGAEGPRDVRIWNAETGEIVKMIETPTMHSFILIPNYFKISQNQDKFSYICSNVENRADKISIWDLKTKETVSNVITTVTRNAFITYEFCDDDKFLITASTDNKLNAWDLSSEKAEYKELGSFPETSRCQ